MGYITYDEYKGNVPEEDFDYLVTEADRIMDMCTTGIDNVRKLKEYFPEEDADIVKACESRIIDMLYDISKAGGYTQTSDGIQPATVASRSAGNESVSYGSVTSAIEKAASDYNEKITLLRRTVKTFLSGLTDANGVNLLYMGVYPCIRTQ